MPQQPGDAHHLIGPVVNKADPRVELPGARVFGGKSCGRERNERETGAGQLLVGCALTFVSWDGLRICFEVTDQKPERIDHAYRRPTWTRWNRKTSASQSNGVVWVSSPRSTVFR